MHISNEIGWGCVLISILAFGIYASPFKLSCVQKVKADPILIQFYMSIMQFVIGCFIFIFVPPRIPYGFSWTGIIGSAIYVPSSVLSIIGINLVGLGIAQGLWSGLSVVINFLWGWIYFRQELDEPGLCIVGIVLLFFGCFVVATSELEINFSKIVRVFRRNNRTDTASDEPENDIVLENTHLLGEKVNSDEEPIVEDTVKKVVQKKGIQIGRYSIGICIVLVQSVLTGSTMVPVRFNPNDEAFLFEFGVGCILITSMLFAFYSLIRAVAVKKPFLDGKQVLHSIIPSFLAGIFWMVGNFAEVFSVRSDLGLALGPPVVQTSMVMSGIVGMVFFDELRGIRKKLQFFGGVCLFIIPGCFLLVFFGPV